jgi:hypothetical protein
MGKFLRWTICVVAVIVLLSVCARGAWATDDTVRVEYTSGDTHLEKWTEGTKFFVDQAARLNAFPAELRGMTFTQRPYNKNADLTLDAPKGTVVCLIIGGGDAATKSRDAAIAAGWERVDDFSIMNGDSRLLACALKQEFTQATHVTIVGTGFCGVVVAARNLEVGDANTPVANQPGTHTDIAVDDAPTAGKTTEIANQQASIKSLEIRETEPGLMLGTISEITLTAVRSDASRQTSVRFVMPIGDDMALSRDEALRYIRLTYPNWYVDKAEISFDNRNITHEGGSAGAAIGTAILSVIQGFAIDTKIVITGDISANGKILAIGGVSAKLRAAIDGKCAIVALPKENYDQLVDAVTYSGISVVTDVQVIGISDLTDAVATARTDRDPKLAQAIKLFAKVQDGLKDSPDYLNHNEATQQLVAVLELAPQHLSAKLLLAMAAGKQPKTLSATASQYYTSLAVRSMLTALIERNESKEASKVPSAVLRTGLADLHKLRPMADPKVRPLIDAWVRFLQAWNDLQTGEGSAHRLETQRQSLLDEMAKENSDPKLMQKILKEGT